ncbi:MAG: hypothetical protein HFE77_02260 [Clostridiales bacterium]|nr:hypothetical protein [Clostridiales bacterium]
MNVILQKARGFIYQNARPIDLARWQYHFENGSKEVVLHALSYYQNKDGGFGHALEADAWNPNSSPIQTWTATEVLREINFTDPSHPIIEGILQYLASGQDFDGTVWYNTIKSNNDYPHAPWWHTESESTSHHSYNPTACLAGFIIRFARPDSHLYKLGCRIAKEAYEALFSAETEADMHTLGCYIRLLQYMEEAGKDDLIDLSMLKTKLCEQVKSSLTTDLTAWKTGYICKPSQFFYTKDSCFYQDNQALSEFECDFIIKTQLKNGSWQIPWGWSDYPEEWAISQNWWKSNNIILNCLYLRGLGRI